MYLQTYHVSSVVKGVWHVSPTALKKRRLTVACVGSFTGSFISAILSIKIDQNHYTIWTIWNTIHNGLNTWKNGENWKKYGLCTRVTLTIIHIRVVRTTCRESTIWRSLSIFLLGFNDLLYFLKKMKIHSPLKKRHILLFPPRFHCQVNSGTTATKGASRPAIFV